ncbi:MAG: ABC transporter ATP-binding protein [bacterium]
MLKIKNLSVDYVTEEKTIHAVDGVSLELRKGEILGIVGESGCGKSTLALSILRLIDSPGKITAGKIEFIGHDLLSMNDHQISSVRGREIAMIFQDPFTSLNPVLSIGEQIAEVLEVHRGYPRDQAISRAKELLTLVHLDDPDYIIKKYPHELSGGMRQRVMIAMALACQPKLLIADEPTTALDVTIQAQILDLLKEITQKFSLSLILISHNMGVISSICSSIAVMYAGRIVEYRKKIDSFFDKPLHPYSKALLRAVPRLDIKGKLINIPGRPPDLSDIVHACTFYPRCNVRNAKCLKGEPDLKYVNPSNAGRCIWVKR